LSRLGIITPRLVLELVVYAALALSAWRTLYVEKFRLIAVVVVASFALRAVLRAVHQSQYPDKPESDEDSRKIKRE
jgi:multisubunit Na+/H+ antiporter MnhG subunit